MEPAPKRPPFIIRTADVPEKVGRYQDSDEDLAHGREIGRAAGLLRIGLHVKRLLPGHRLSYPHAEENEEEFVYVLEGAVDAWIDGDLHPMECGDLAAFPAGTGIAHTFINNGASEAVPWWAGEGTRPTTASPTRATPSAAPSSRGASGGRRTVSSARPARRQTDNEMTPLPGFPDGGRTV